MSPDVIAVLVGVPFVIGLVLGILIDRDRFYNDPTDRPPRGGDGLPASPGSTFTETLNAAWNSEQGRGERRGRVLRFPTRFDREAA